MLKRANQPTVEIYKRKKQKVELKRKKPEVVHNTNVLVFFLVYIYILGV